MKNFHVVETRPKNNGEWGGGRHFPHLPLSTVLCCVPSFWSRINMQMEAPQATLILFVADPIVAFLEKIEKKPPKNNDLLLSSRING